MSRRAVKGPSHEIYPAKYFDDSKTWFAWNNLTAADVFGLRTEPGFEGQNTYFHLNHPIRFVRLVGFVAEIDLKGGKWILITLDDSSGRCIEIKTSLRQLKPDDHAEYPSNTVIDNLDAHVKFGAPSLFIDKNSVDIGSIIKAKGTIDSFRNTRQLKLERVSVVKDTSEEVEAWASTSAWKRNVLSKPWVMTLDRRKQLDKQMKHDEIRHAERSKKRRLYDAKDADRKRRKVEKTEEKRKQDELKFNAGALPGSNAVPMRLTDS